MGYLNRVIERKKNKIMTNIEDAGDAYYETYSDIKKGNDKK